jgi:hypothetical protein
MLPLERWYGPASYTPDVIRKVSIAGSPPSNTTTVNVQEDPQVPLIVAVDPTTEIEVIDVLLIDTPLPASV